jgi:6,7-dimethyl-8-ribityllumazine synthase
VVDNLRAPMSTELPDRPPPLATERMFAVVASSYNTGYVDGLIAGAKTEFAAIAPASSVELHRVPGSFEIPLVVQELAEHGTLDAILAFGLIWQGETLHADLIATAVTRALMEISLRFRVPVLHEVIVVRTEEQARERCLEPRLNRGVEAARAAVRMLKSLDGIRQRNR